MNDKDREAFEAYFRNEYADELARYPDLLDKYPSGKYKERDGRVSYADFLAGIDYARKEQTEWQPIETLPYGGVFEIYLAHSQEVVIIRRVRHPTSICADTIGDYWYSAGADMRRKYADLATHWRKITLPKDCKILTSDRKIQLEWDDMFNSKEDGRVYVFIDGERLSVNKRKYWQNAKDAIEAAINSAGIGKE